MIGSARIYEELSRRFSNDKTSLGEPIQVVLLDKSSGVVVRDASFIQRAREAAIKEYFFGDVRRTLSPQIQQADFSSLVIYKITDRTNPPFTPLVMDNEYLTWQQTRVTTGKADSSVRSPPR